jgi:hypothetical protein
MTPDRAYELETICQALVAAIGEAQVRLEQGPLDERLAHLVLHARELHTAMCEALITSEPDVEERVRGLAEAIGNHLELLEAEILSS